MVLHQESMCTAQEISAAVSLQMEIHCTTQLTTGSRKKKLHRLKVEKIQWKNKERKGKKPGVMVQPCNLAHHSAARISYKFREFPAEDSSTALAGTRERTRTNKLAVQHRYHIRSLHSTWGRTCRNWREMGDQKDMSNKIKLVRTKWGGSH